ncbi:hypothetical protein M3Y96_00407100 [Aphelenchoides besseyi]|nr:hypothetical protein M3Y96_00407100 [Aphelenchoides besseyi]
MSYYDPTKTIFCSSHVHQVTFVIAVISVALQVFWSLNQVISYDSVRLNGYHHHSSAFSVVLGILLGFLINGTLLYGNWKRRPGYYWPYMIFNGFLLALSVFGGIFVLIFVMGVGLSKGFDGVQGYHEYYVYGQNANGTVLYGEEHPLNSYNRSAFFTTAFLFSIFYAFSVLIQWYLFSIVVRDYKYLRAQEKFVDTYDQLEKEFEYAPNEKDAQKIVVSA